MHHYEFMNCTNLLVIYFITSYKSGLFRHESCFFAPQCSWNVFLQGPPFTPIPLLKSFPNSFYLIDSSPGRAGSVQVIAGPNFSVLVRIRVPLRRRQSRKSLLYVISEARILVGSCLVWFDWDVPVEDRTFEEDCSEVLCWKMLNT